MEFTLSSKADAYSQWISWYALFQICIEKDFLKMSIVNCRNNFLAPAGNLCRTWDTAPGIRIAPSELWDPLPKIAYPSSE